MSAMDALVADATAKLEHLETALEALQQLRERYTTRDGAITAEVDGHGALTGLWLDESVATLAAKEVGPAITQACQEAAARAGVRRAAVLTELNRAFTAP